MSVLQNSNLNNFYDDEDEYLNEFCNRKYTSQPNTCTAFKHFRIILHSIQRFYTNTRRSDLLMSFIEPHMRLILAAADPEFILWNLLKNHTEDSLWIIL